MVCLIGSKHTLRYGQCLIVHASPKNAKALLHMSKACFIFPANVMRSLTSKIRNKQFSIPVKHLQQKQSFDEKFCLVGIIRRSMNWV